MRNLYDIVFKSRNKITVRSCGKVLTIFALKMYLKMQK